ncbi:hypothetical protein GCM10011487_29400 [Steroidobacter agaridevorans]|uniref:Uncharacterized protein n=1 Tax=Steroidobacter agaridevorans TaxID=2695856 RepID=A0A829YCC9_9GAMM|nr:hypothetical protein GCM10011487_29400 [Steroidobacter agaridevorans]GFE89176.1 hypothetical protein GCM10011488_41300 [Steroidobacter agaridevorans]
MENRLATRVSAPTSFCNRMETMWRLRGLIADPFEVAGAVQAPDWGVTIVVIGFAGAVQKRKGREAYRD